MIHMKKWLVMLAVGTLVVALTACGGSSEVGQPPTPTPTTAAVPTATLSRALPTATPTRAPTATPTPSSVSTGTPPASGGSSQVIDIDITTDPYLFIPDTFRFLAGKKYTLRFKAPKEFHTFTVTGLGLDIQVYPGQVTERAVSFSDVGTYKLVCIIHEQLGQTGKVIVTQGP
ncbi:MAG: hypothetical protein HYU29_07555 [Chloroflexi bacterium]|nr:hypothetical protein [Chloroflexota bacterium]